MIPARQVRLAVLLRQAGASFVVVGGTARALRGAADVPKDLDIAVRPDRIALLRSALRRVTSNPLRPTGASPRRVLTSWSPIDVFVGEDLPAWHMVEIEDVRLQVADE